MPEIGEKQTVRILKESKLRALWMEDEGARTTCSDPDCLGLHGTTLPDHCGGYGYVVQYAAGGLCLRCGGCSVLVAIVGVAEDCEELIAKLKGEVH